MSPLRGSPYARSFSQGSRLGLRRLRRSAAAWVVSARYVARRTRAHIRDAISNVFRRSRGGADQSASAAIPKRTSALFTFGDGGEKLPMRFFPFSWSTVTFPP